MTGDAYKDEEWLREKYFDERMTVEGIAELADAHENTIYRWMEKHGIERVNGIPQDCKLRDEDWLREEYVSNQRTIYEIAEECGVTAPCVANWMEKYGIDRRDMREAQISDGPHTDEEWLREKYTGEGLSTYKIADLCDVSQRTIMNWLGHFDIPTEDVGPRSGRGNQSWVEYSGFSTSNNGYEVSYSSWGGEIDAFVLHRLAAVAWFGWDAAIEREMHHRIPIEWLNVEPNLHPLSKQEHMIISGKYKSDGVPEEVVTDVLKKLG